MSPMDGSEFMARAHAEDALDRVPVVVLSADPRVAGQLRGRPLAGYLEKPVDVATLMSVVRRFCPVARP
jgi:CheY-like chemotaxis protein